MSKWSKVKPKENMLGLSPLVQICLHVAPRKTKAVLLFDGTKRGSNWVGKHHMQENICRRIILTLNCSSFYELELHVIENWLIQSRLLLITVLWKRVREGL